MEIKGIVQDITNNSIKIDKIWIKFFDKNLLNGINKNDNVQVKYTDNVKDDKTYHNGKEIKKLIELTSKPEINTRPLDTTTVNTIIMCSKDLVLKSMEDKRKFDDERLTFKQALKEILEGLSEVTIKVKTD